MERICFVHPQERNLVIKVPIPELSQTSTANLHEYRGYTLLRQEHGDLSVISHCHGFIATDLGEGLLCDCIRDESGEVSKTL